MRKGGKAFTFVNYLPRNEADVIICDHRKQTIEQTKMAIKDFQEQYSILLDQMSLENSLKSTKAPALPDGSRQGSRLDLLRGSSSRGMVVRQGSSRFGKLSL